MYFSAAVYAESVPLATMNMACVCSAALNKRTLPRLLCTEYEFCLLLRTYCSVVSVSVAAVNCAFIVSAAVYRPLVNVATVCKGGISRLVSTEQMWAPAIFPEVRFRWSAI